MLLKELYDRGPRLYPRKVGLVDASRRLSYREAGERYDRLANALLALGLQRGDRLGLLLKNGTEMIEAHAAGAKTGVAVGAVNYRMSLDGMQRVLQSLGCRVLVVDAEYAGRIASIRSELRFLESCVVVGDAFEGMHEYEALLARSSPSSSKAKTHPDDRAAIVYTTGTTGAPKGAVVTRAITMNRVCSFAIEMAFGPADRWLQVLPMFHVGVHAAQSMLFRAGTLALLRDWDVEMFCRTVQELRINKTNLAPALLNSVLNWPGTRDYDLASLELMLYGAAPMPEAVMLKARRLLPNCRFVQAYGSAETFCPVWLQPDEHALALGGTVASEQRRRACGRAGALAMARVVNEHGDDVAPGDVGEVLIGGGTVMTEYLGQPEQTAAVLTDGWYRSNDLATVDDEGYISIVDRKDFMIITGGENVFPSQVENVLASHPAVAAVAVIGLPDDKWGEIVKAIIVLQPGRTATAEDIVDFCRGRMANYEKPKSIDFVAELPHGATGKTDKLTLRKRYLDALNPS
jgi:long-chain acyl-CoA synthetase